MNWDEDIRLKVDPSLHSVVQCTMCPNHDISWLISTNGDERNIKRYMFLADATIDIAVVTLEVKQASSTALSL